MEEPKALSVTTIETRAENCSIVMITHILSDGSVTQDGR